MRDFNVLWQAEAVEPVGAIELNYADAILHADVNVLVARHFVVNCTVLRK